MKYLSLFSGVGGFELGIQRAFLGFERDNSDSDINRRKLPQKELKETEPRSYTCIGYSEIDKYAIATYERNFNGHRNYGDCTTINETELPDFDLLVGGFPCQAFSVAGKRHGFNDTRGTLFFDIARILAYKKPRHFLLENVKGLLSHDSGKTFQTILGVLTDLGYDVEWQVLNAKDFGVPQNRERIFIVGHLGGECGRQVFPLQRNNGQDTQVHPREKTLAPTVSSGYSKNQSDAPYIVHNIYKGFGEDVRKFEDYAPTVRTPAGGGHLPSLVEGTRIRRLTPTECERLMSWPDGWTIGSDTQRYKQCGNGVVSNVVQAVIENMKGCL